MMLSALVAVAASATAPKVAGEVVSPLRGGLNFKAAVENSERGLRANLTSQTAAKHTAATTSLKRKSPRKAEGAEGSKYDGIYILSLGDYYFYTSMGPVDIEVELFVEDGMAEIYDLSEEWFISGVLADFDEETGVMTFSNMYIGELEDDTDGSMDAISFMPTRYDEAAEELNFIGQFSITYDEASESFVFPTDGDYGFSWAYWNSGSNPAYLEDAQSFATPQGYYNLFDVEAMEKAAQTWSQIGTGEWYEGLLTIYNDVDEGWHWPVKIEECDQTPGLYRMKPYAVANNPIAQIIGYADSYTTVIVDATNPEKVYTIGDFEPYGLTTFCGFNPENEFEDGDGYGTLKDKIITFPDASFAYFDYDEYRWYTYSKDFKIALPGAVVKDYVLKATTEFACSDGPTTTVNLTVGADIVKTYMDVYKGYADTSYGTNGQIVAANGTEVPAGSSVTFNTPAERGHYSIMFAGVDADNNVVATSTTYQIVDGEADADWKVVPNTTTKFTEGFLAGMFGNIDAEDFNVVLEESVSTPGRFRFEAPYAKHSLVEYFAMADHSANHKHYIYVNATDPAKVYVEPSSLGLSMSGFDAIYVHTHANTGYYANNVIEAPAYVTTNNIARNYSGGTIKLVMTKSDSKIEEISAGAADKVIYDIQGRRVANATRGIFIVNGQKTLVK